MSKGQKLMLVEGFNDEIGIAEDILQAAKEGRVELYNAARPFPCHGEILHGEFRRGVFYGTIAPNEYGADGYRDRAWANDAYRVEWVTKDEVRRQVQAYYNQEYPGVHVDVAKHESEHGFTEIFRSWLHCQETA